ncbi:MAG: VCBS repeat-containing protein [Candidatus Krumholzibacteria bacterium]|nr:VCBS repeat-containing protein [Candidatus Krumholzibacteria bacterium]
MRRSRCNFIKWLIVCSSLLAAFVTFTSCETEEKNTRRNRDFENEPAVTLLLLDFEDGLEGKWTRFDSFGEKMDHYVTETTDYNLSEKYLHIRVKDGEEKGSLYFDFAENGIAPIPLSMRTRVAWSWTVSRNVGTNGLWIIFKYVDTATGEVQLVRCASWNESTFDVLRVYFDPKMTWVFHQERTVNFIGLRMAYDEASGTRSTDFSYDNVVLTGIALGVSRAEGLEGGIDNIWVGEGHAPEEINTIDKKQQITEVQRSRLKAFSYGYLNNDLLPDRVDVYGDRIEIVDGKESDYSRNHRDMVGIKGVVEKEKKLLRKDYFREQRLPTAVSIADLDGNGQNDILIQFEDVLGQIYFSSDLMKGQLRDATKHRGALRSGYNKFYGSAVADIDGDSDLDLVLLNPICRRGRVGGIRSIRNEGRYFREWTFRSGVASLAAFGGAFADLDGDGDQDFFAAYRTHDIEQGKPFESRLYMNDGTGVFESDRQRFVLPADLHIEGVVLADLDNDADIDIYVVVNEKGFTGETILVPNILFRNDGKGYFSDVSTGIAEWSAHKSEAAVAEDFDHDGDIDIVDISTSRGSVYYRNEGDLRFVESMHSDLTMPGSFRNGLGVDFDHDGDMDIALHDRDVDGGPVIIPNGCAKGGFIEVTLRGVKGNRAGIGGKVYLYESGHIGSAEHLVGFREIHAERGFGWYGPPVAHFGIDTLETVDIMVVFPAVNGEPPEQVVRHGVRENSFVWIPETHNRLLELWYSYKVERFKYLFISGLFKIPVWILALVMFVMTSFAGVNVKARFDKTSRWRLPHGVISDKGLFWTTGLALLLLVAAFYRSWPWSASAVLASIVIVAVDRDHTRIIGRLLGFRHDPEMEETFLIQKISRILHAEQNFRFLIDFTNVGTSTIERYRKILDSGLTDLDRCVEMMRKVIPDSKCWKDAARELSGLKEIFSDFLSLDAEVGDIRRGELNSRYNKAVERFNASLLEGREILRSRYSLDFITEWNGLIKRQENDLLEAGVMFSIDQVDVEGAGIYLTRGEFNDIFNNLLTNSIWAVSGADRRRIMVEISKDRMFLKVNWLDSGCGIDPEIRDVLFLMDVKSQRPKGKGMGCHNAGQIIRNRQGRVRVEDPPDGWSTMIVMKFIRTK